MITALANRHSLLFEEWICKSLESSFLLVAPSRSKKKKAFGWSAFNFWSLFIDDLCYAFFDDLCLLSKMVSEGFLSERDWLRILTDFKRSLKMFFTELFWWKAHPVAEKEKTGQRSIYGDRCSNNPLMYWLDVSNHILFCGPQQQRTRWMTRYRCFLLSITSQYEWNILHKTQNTTHVECVQNLLGHLTGFETQHQSWNSLPTYHFLSHMCSWSWNPFMNTSVGLPLDQKWGPLPVAELSPWDHSWVLNGECIIVLMAQWL